MKFCSKCATLKSILEFNKRSDRRGPRAHCKVCMSKEACVRSAAKCNRRLKLSPEEKKRSIKKAQKKFNQKPQSKAKNALREAGRRARKLKATPHWLSNYDRVTIRHHYELARYLTDLWEVRIDVDHIIPLMGKEVCGLHVPWNLQLLEHTVNVKKNNRVDHE